ncbi:MAG TPA: leucyl aminopeptidase [Pseudomonadales bacterium]
MQFTAKTANPATLTTDCLVAAVFDDKVLPEATQALDDASGRVLSKIVAAGDIGGKLGQTLLLQKVDGIRAKRILLVGCGKAKELDAKKYGAIMRNTYRALKQHSIDSAALTLTALPVAQLSPTRKAEILARNFEMQTYRYVTTKSRPGTNFTLKEAVVLTERDRGATAKGLATGAAIGRGMNLTRELGNLPANICTPTFLGKEAQRLARRYSRLMTAQTLTETQMRRLGMNSLLSVGNGSDQDSALIIMKYQGAPAREQPHVIVGKGITFDTGGISLKPGLGMDEMKFDMCGAASVLGCMQALCELKPAINVIGVIAAAENMPSGRATKPGDIVTTMSGQTVEILNTDAEGRLVLCDALTYVERFKPKTVVDIATLTGACITALGTVCSGLMSPDDELAQTLYLCGIETGDPCWRLPLWDDYQEQLNSNFADIANIGGPKAGTVTAGCFLARFTKKYRWAHLDIAGTAWQQGAEKGATGRPVPLLMEYLLNH